MFRCSEDEGKNIEDLNIIKYETIWNEMSIEKRIETYQRADILQYSVDLFPGTNDITEAYGGKIGLCANTECPLRLLGYRADLTLKMCSRCKMVRYCSEECQKRHWKLHKMDCNKDEIFNYNNIKKAKIFLKNIIKNENIFAKLKEYAYAQVEKEKVKTFEDIGHFFCIT